MYIYIYIYYYMRIMTVSSSESTAADRLRYNGEVYKETAAYFNVEINNRSISRAA